MEANPSRERARRDAVLLFVARGFRGLGAGALSVVLALDLVSVGYSLTDVGILVGLAMAAGALWSIAAPVLERRLGRRPLFVLGATTFAVGGFVLWWDLGNAVAVVGALLLGNIVTASDISELGSVEQAGLAAVSEGNERTWRYAVYNLVGYLGAAVGAVLVVPLASFQLSGHGLPPGLHDPALLFYGLLGLALLPAYLALSSDVEPRARATPVPLSRDSRGPVLELSGLFAVDAFGGGLIANSLVTAFLVARFHPSVLAIGAILAGASIAAAVSLVLAVPIAQRIGLVRTMVFTHLPSDVLLVAVAFLPSLTAVAFVWIVRATLSQMDVPTRQAFVQSIVRPGERLAAAGYTTAGRSGQALGAPLTGAMLRAGGGWLGGPFVLSGGIKIVYDLLVYHRFRRRDRSGSATPEA